MYQAMGYNADQASQQVEEDKMIAEKETGAAAAEATADPKEKTMAIKQTKEEQDALLNKMRAFAQRNADPEITANYMDFSKPVDDESNEVN